MTVQRQCVWVRQVWCSADINLVNRNTQHWRMILLITHNTLLIITVIIVSKYTLSQACSHSVYLCRSHTHTHKSSHRHIQLSIILSCYMMHSICLSKKWFVDIFGHGDLNPIAGWGWGGGWGVGRSPVSFSVWLLVAILCVWDYSSGPLASCIGLIPGRMLLSLSHSHGEYRFICQARRFFFPHLQKKSRNAEAFRGHSLNHSCIFSHRLRTRKRRKYLCIWAWYR